MSITLDLSERDLDLIEVALDAAANVCTSFTGSGGEEELEKEYRHALARIQEART